MDSWRNLAPDWWYRIPNRTIQTHFDTFFVRRLIFCTFLQALLIVQEAITFFLLKQNSFFQILGQQHVKTKVEI